MDEPADPTRTAVTTTGEAARPFVEAPFSTAPPSRWRRVRGPLLTAGIVGGLTVALHFRDPHSSGSWGICPWLALTGQYCPGCGGLRAVNDLTNGDLVGAASSNLVFVLMIPLLVFWWLRWTGRAWTGAAFDAGPGAAAGSHAAASGRTRVWIALATVAMLAFTVLRNLPTGSWLAP